MSVDLPTCEIVYPFPDNPVAGVTTIVVNASSYDRQIETVEIRIDDGPWVLASETVSWTYDWNTTAIANGEHDIHARSYDSIAYSNETSVTIIVDNEVPNPPPNDGETASNQVLTWIGVALILTAVIAVSLILLVRIRRKKEMGDEKERSS